MSRQPLCPILLIGFPAPESDKAYDFRRCTTECAWYDRANECCAIANIADTLAGISSNLAELTYYYGSAEPDEEESYEFDPNVEAI